MKRVIGQVWAVALLTVGLADAGMFEDGEIVCFLGDSITNGGKYQCNIQNYYLTRFPKSTIRFVNAGRSGDTAGGASRRLKEDVIDIKPTSVAIMFGMNDVGRGYYVESPNEKHLAGQKRALERYGQNMETLTGRILSEAGNPRLFFLTPSPFDQTMVNDRDNNQPGCNDGLGRCADIVRELAVANNATLIDFHGPMTALNLEQQKRDPKYTIVGPDRVHPWAPGLLMMAWLFLKEQGVPSLVSRVAVDAPSGRVVAAENADVSAVTPMADGVTFTVLARALPFPASRYARERLGKLPIENDLNQELLAVSGLAEGTYVLTIGDSDVGRYSAADLAAGINLGFNEATPQYKQAQEVAKRAERHRVAVLKWRDLLNSRRWMKNHYKIDVDDADAVQAHYDHFENKRSYSAIKTRQYIEQWSRYDEYVKTSKELENELFSGRTPVPHVYHVAPVEEK